ncbi:MAG: hypothetical protein Fur0043_03590 [Anaerolineales bacterium]
MNSQKQPWLDRPIHPALPGIRNEILLFVGILLLALVTRFYNLEARVMSHDESLHTYFSWLFYRGGGYEHTPMMHGPLQFHLIALTYFIFGVNDFTSRIPAVLFSLATIWMVWYWRRYLGKTGALVAAFLMVISPYMLYYGRYVRNEAYAGFSGVLMLYAILRFLESGGKRYLYLVTAALLIHFTAKETAFIYTAQALVFLAIYFVAQVTRQPWPGSESLFRSFLLALMLGILLMGGALGTFLYQRSGGTLTATETAMPANPNAPLSPLEGMQTASPPLAGILAGLGVLALVFAVIFLIKGYTWRQLQEERSFSLLMLIGVLVLPLLTPFPIQFLEPWLHVTIPTTAAEVNTLLASPPVFLGMPRDMLIVGLIVIVMFALSILLGQLWNREWWKFGLLFWSLFTILFTAVFTNTDGFFTGLIGSLGYWLVQQDVQRGSQPWYFYVLVQIPVYEFLPALGALLAAWLGIKKLLVPVRKNARSADEAAGSIYGELSASESDPLSAPALEGITAEEAPVSESDPQLAPTPPALPASDSDSVNLSFVNTFSLLLWWVITSIIALGYAGERMPWLTYHMAWPMILLTGWGIGHLIESVNWGQSRLVETALRLALSALFLIGLFSAVSALAGPNPPFQGKDLNSLRATNAFLLPALVALASAGGLVFLLREEWNDLLKAGLTLLFILTILGVIFAVAEYSANGLMGRDRVILVRLILLATLALASLSGLIFLGGRSRGNFPALLTLTFFALLTVLTARAAFRAAYVNYDSAMEYLVYAHGAGPIKQVMKEAEQISQRTTGGMDMLIAYDASAPDTGVSWPFVWYLRDFTNQRAFDQPTKSLRDAPFVIVDAKNFDKIEPALGPGYYRFDYIRMWWPNQDYFGLTWNRIATALSDPNIRAGIWDIWFDRDYTRYAQATGHTDLSEITWEPSDRMRLYLRKDVAAQIWNYGAAPVETVTIQDPTEGKAIYLPADLVWGEGGEKEIALNAPRALSFAPDGTLYIADSRNHRIVHLDASGNQLGQWGSFADGISSPAVPGTFNEPWGVAVGPDGSVYVTDTWNHRVQKFTASGRLLTTWGQYGTEEQKDGFWGPRGIAVDSQGYVYVADTGNKRIVVFDADGNYISEFGSAGLQPGQFDEPVGVVIDNSGKLFVTDTWNQRVQSFTISEDRLTFLPDRQWEVFGWYGQSLDNKPFIAVNAAGHVFVTDPEQHRVIEFTGEGEVVRTWGDAVETETTFGLTAGIAVDTQGHIWVTDALYNRVLRFTLPKE